MASVAITVFSGGSNRAVVALERLPLSMRLENAVLSYAIYMKDMLWPVGLAAFYPLLPPKAPSVVAALVVLTVITVAVVVGRRRFPYLLVGWLWYLGTLVPVIGLVQAGDQGRADRFTYVPLIGLFMIIAWGTVDATRRSRRATAALPFAALIVVALSAAAARNQAAFWATDLSLWTRTVAVTQRNYRAENHLGVALSNEGRLSDAVEHYSAALAIWPEYPEAHNNLGTARVDQGRIDDAFHEFSEAVRVRPRAADFHYNLGVVMSMRGDTTGAIREIITASVLDPGSARYQHALDILRHAPGS
jgi:Flp pilus assembly protein TadD, contains TPR repeats